MKNNIRELTTIYAYTDINLIKNNNVKVLINNLDDIIDVHLTSSKMKLFKKYGLNKMVNKFENMPLSDRNLILKDIENFRKYYDHFSFSKDLDQIKIIFVKNNISLELLYRYIDSSDYLWLRDLDENELQSGILVDKNKYNNILIDLKTESIPKEILYDYPISLIFKFLITKKGYIIDLVDPGNLDKFSNQLIELEEKGYISKYYHSSLEYELDLDLEFYEDSKNIYEYNGYSGNYETYFTFKALLREYLEGINLYNYQGKYYTYDQFKNIYDIFSLEHSKFINDNLLEYTDDIDKSIEDLTKYHPEVIKVSCKCIDVQDPLNIDSKNTLNYITEPLASLKLIFIIKSIESEVDQNKKTFINPFNTITMDLSDFLSCG